MWYIYIICVRYANILIVRKRILYNNNLFIHTHYCMFISAERVDVFGLLPRGANFVVVVMGGGGVAYGNQYKRCVRSPGYYKSVYETHTCMLNCDPFRYHWLKLQY